MSIQLKDIQSRPNGAQFYTADLHIHSHGASHDVDDASMTVETIIDEAVKHHLGIVAITDHNTIQNTQRSIDHAEQYVGRLLVLAGVEITTAHGHLLVYFAPTEVARLNTFLGRIEIEGAGMEESHTKMSMSDVIREAERQGGVCVAAHIDRKTGFEQFARGYPNWKKDILGSSGLCGVEVADSTNLNWYSITDEGTPNGAERKKLLATRKEAKAALAHIQSSDAHTLQDFQECARSRRLTRIKLDTLTFESLRTALADPDARVKPQADLPPGVAAILGIHVQGGFLNGETYHFSDNMNCFIGGRGTGKSTALKCLTYALGVNDQIEEYGNCPDTILVYCRDAQGIEYRYQRMRGEIEPTVHVKYQGQITEAPVDSFRIEYYGQGDLARVAEDPLKNAHLFQEFLDRHTGITEHQGRETTIVEELEGNGSQLRPLETQEATRAQKEKELKGCDEKLELAKKGKLKEIAASQEAIGAEKAFVKALQDVQALYRKGTNLKKFVRNYETIASQFGTFTGAPESEARFTAIQELLSDTNAYLLEQEKAINRRLREVSSKLSRELTQLGPVHGAMDQKNAAAISSLQKAGLSASIADHRRTIQRRGQLAKEIATLNGKRPELKRLRKERTELLHQLEEERERVSRERRKQLAEINRHLKRVIDDYTVVVLYDPEGLYDSYLELVQQTMQGSWFPEESAKRLCQNTTPQKLAAFVRNGDDAAITKVVGGGKEWGEEIVRRFQPLATFHQLEVTAKPMRPTIRIVTKTHPPKDIPVTQLSDGQKNTIFLTIAMLAESAVPLVIDQPEDDLDNAFIFSSVVQMLRNVKEQRQVFVVTHNANIAVLGDAELLLPMRRTGEQGGSLDLGSIDREETKHEVQRILEGGELAFLRRKEIYGH